MRRNVMNTLTDVLGMELVGDVDPEVFESTDNFHGVSVGFLEQAFKLKPDPDDPIEPVWLLGWKKEREIGVLHTPWENRETKALCVALMGKIIRETQPDFYSIGSEVWMATVNEGTSPDEARKQVRDMKDHVDGLTILTVPRARPHNPIYMAFEIRKKRLREIELLDGVISGRMAELYHEPTRLQ